MHVRWVRLWVAGALATVLSGLAVGCGEDPFALSWVASPDTVVVYSVARPDLNLPSVYDFVNRRALRIESPTTGDDWDILIDTRGGALVVLAQGAVGIASRARVTELPNTDFDAVEEAPGDTAVYTATEAIPLRTSSVYIVRTRQEIGSFGSACVFYAKFSPLSVNLAEGTVEILYDINNNLVSGCNNRRLIPPN